jgi:hypothetical protein
MSVNEAQNIGDAETATQIQSKPVDTAPTLRLVKWQNIWNWTLEESGTTRIHITAARQRSGKTLCGRPFPVEKGYPVSLRFCKRCLAKAKTVGHSIEQVRKFAEVA